MGVSVPDSRPHVPGFRDSLGERLTVEQPSRGELEYLYFCQPLASAPFFAPSLKTRVARLARFSHGSYCRVRRVEQAADGDGSLALVSRHVAGRRLAEILDVAARADLKPTTAGVLALTRQVMTAAALLHDFSPDGFHGTLGPERLILAADGRVVIAEHVLGTAVEQAASAWGTARLWQEFRVAALPDTGQAHYGRRTDVLQIGLTAFAFCLGRPLEAGDYPDQLGYLLARATETKSDRTDVPMRSSLRTWFERTLALRGDSSYETLLDAQKAFGQLMQDADYAGASAEWEGFVRLCETAAIRVPLVVRVPPPTEAAPAAAILQPVAAIDAQAGADGETPERSEVPSDPFGPWPVSVPAESTATLFDAFMTAPPIADPVLPIKPTGPTAATQPAKALPPHDGAEAAPDPWAQAKASPVHPEPLFDGQDTGMAAFGLTPSEVRPEPLAQSTSLADWHTAEAPALQEPAAHVESGTVRRSASLGAQPKVGRQPTSRRWVRLVVIAVVGTVGIAAAAYAPRLWTVVYSTFRTSGRVTVESNPPGALISVDGQVRGHTPAALRLQPGTHVLEVQVGGSAKTKAIVVQARADTTETFTLPEAGARGGFRITTYPSPGRITIDGKFRGEAPLKVTDLTPGTHTLVVESTLGTQEQDVVVQSGAVLQLAVPTASWVKVNTSIDLEVLEDGRLLGNTATGPVLVRPGRHRLDFANRELGLKLRQLIDAVPGQVVTVPLELPNGMMNVYADQTAEVFVDGQKVGDTPVPSLQLPLGPHEVVLRHPKYGEARYTVRVTLAAPVNLNVTFRKQ
jgi:hypothetical protein